MQLTLYQALPGRPALSIGGWAYISSTVDTFVQIPSRAENPLLDNIDSIPFGVSSCLTGPIDAFHQTAESAYLSLTSSRT